MILWETYFDSAQQAMAEADYPKASELFSSALDEVESENVRDERWLRTLLGWSRCLVRQQIFDRALHLLQVPPEELAGCPSALQVEHLELVAELHRASGDMASELAHWALWVVLVQSLPLDGSRIPLLERALELAEKFESVWFLSALEMLREWCLKLHGETHAETLKATTRLMDYYLRTEAWASAERLVRWELEQAAADRPTWLRARLKLAMILRKQAQIEEAWTVYEELFKSRCLTPEEEMEVLQWAWQNGLAEPAQSVALDSLLRQESPERNHVELLSQVAALASPEDRLRLYQLRVAWAEQLDIDAPQKQEWVHQLAVALENRGQAEQAYEHWQQILQQGLPQSAVPDAYLRLARRLRRTGESALEAYRQALMARLTLPTWEADWFEDAFDWARLELIGGNLVTAGAIAQPLLEQLQKYHLESQPLFPRTLFLLAQIQAPQAQFENAQKLLSRSFSQWQVIHEPPELGLEIAQMGAVVAVETRSREHYDLWAQHLREFGDEPPAFEKGFDEAAAQALIQSGQWAALELELREVLPKITEESPEEHLVALLWLGDCLEQQGRWADSLEHRQDAHARLLQRLGASHPLTLKSQMQLGQCYNALSRFGEGEKILAQAVRQYEKAFGADSLEVGRVLMALAESFRLQGKDNLMEAVSGRAVGLLEKHLPLGHPERLQAKRDLVQWLMDQGRFGEARQQLEYMEQEEIQAYGPDHPELAVTLSQWAALDTAEGKYAEAEAHYRRSLELFQRGLGDSHPNVAATLNNLGQNLYRQANFEAAAEALTRALDLFEAHDGGRVSTMVNLGLVLQAQHQLTQAQEWLEKALQLSVAWLGEDDLEVAFCCFTLAEVLHAQGQFDEAKAMAQRALDIRERRLGSLHPETATSQAQLSRLLLESGRGVEAIPAVEGSLKIQMQALGEDHPELIPTYATLGRLYMTAEEWQKAEDVLLRAVHLLDKSTTQYSLELAQLVADLGQLRSGQGDLEQAVGFSAKAVEIAAEALGPQHEALDPMMLRLARLYLAQARFKEAEVCFKRILDQRTQRLGNDHPQVALVWLDLAGLQLAQNKPVLAETLAKKSLDLIQRALGSEHPELKPVLQFLHDLTLAAGRKEQAEAYAQQIQAVSAGKSEELPSVPQHLENVPLPVTEVTPAAAITPELNPEAVAPQLGGAESVTEAPKPPTHVAAENPTLNQEFRVEPETQEIQPQPCVEPEAQVIETESGQPEAVSVPAETISAQPEAASVEVNTAEPEPELTEVHKVEAEPMPVGDEANNIGPAAMPTEPESVPEALSAEPASAEAEPASAEAEAANTEAETVAAETVAVSFAAEELEPTLEIVPAPEVAMPETANELPPQPEESVSPTDSVTSEELISCPEPIQNTELSQEPAPSSERAQAPASEEEVPSWLLEPEPAVELTPEEKAAAAVSAKNWVYAREILAPLVGQRTGVDLAEVLRRLAQVDRHLGQRPQAERSLLQALTLWSQEYGENHPELAWSMGDLAEICFEMGKAEQAEGLLRRATEIQVRLHGTDHESMIPWLLRLGTIYLPHKPSQALAPLQRAAVLGQSRLSASDPTLAEIFWNLAQAHEKAQEVNEAIACLRKRLQFPDSEEALRAQLMLARLLLQTQQVEAATQILHKLEVYLPVPEDEIEEQVKALMGHILALNDRLEEAEPRLLEALQLRTQRLSTQHKELLPILIDLSRLYSAREADQQVAIFAQQALELLPEGDIEQRILLLTRLAPALLRLDRRSEAEGLYQNWLELIVQQEGANSKALLPPLQALARLAQSKGESIQAQDYREQAWQILSQGADVTETEFLGPLEELARGAMEQAAWDKAESWLRRAYAIAEKQDVLAAGRLAFALGEVFRATQRFTEAENAIRRSLEFRQNSLGAEHVETLRSLQSLAEVYSAQGRFEAAQSMLSRCLEAGKNSLGEGHPDLAGFHRSLGALAAQTQRLEEAEDSLQQALKLVEGLTPVHPELVPTLEALGLFYQQLDRLAQAAPYFSRALDSMEQQLGPSHLAVADSLLQLGELHQRQGNSQEAEKYFRRCLEIRSQKLPAHHAKLAQVRQVLAQLLQKQGQTETARELFDQALAALWSEQGAETPQVAECLEGLGLLELQGGQFAEAEARFNKALAIREKEPENRQGATVKTHQLLARVFLESRRQEMAERSLKRALEIAQKVHGGDRPEVAACLEQLGHLYLNQGRYVASEALFDRAMEIRERNHQSKHPDSGFCLLGLAQIYLAQNQLNQAWQTADTARQIFEGVPQQPNLDTAQALYLMAETLRLQGRHRESEGLYQRCLEIRNKLLGNDHPEVQRGLHGLGVALMEQGKAPQAERVFTHALRLLEARLGNEHLDLANILHSLGLLHRSLGRGATAELHLKRALEIRTRALGSEHPDLAASLQAMGQLYLDQRNDAAAENFLKQALSIRERALRADHPALSALLLLLAGLYKSQERFAEAEPRLKRVLDQREKLLGTHHPDTASILQELGELYLLQSQAQQAEVFLKKALDIYEKRLGQEHPSILPCLHLLWKAYDSQKRVQDAAGIRSRIQLLEVTRPSS